MYSTSFKIGYFTAVHLISKRIKARMTIDRNSKFYRTEFCIKSFCLGSRYISNKIIFKKIPIDNRQRPVNDIKNNSHSFIPIIFYHSLITIKDLKIHTYLLRRCHVFCIHVFILYGQGRLRRWDEIKKKDVWRFIILGIIYAFCSKNN